MIWPGRHQIGMVAAMRLELVAAFVGIRSIEVGPALEERSVLTCVSDAGRDEPDRAVAMFLIVQSHDTKPTVRHSATR
jgi:hypothetical protein